MRYKVYHETSEECLGSFTDEELAYELIDSLDRPASEYIVEEAPE